MNTDLDRDRRGRLAMPGLFAEIECTALLPD
jgi:hypothetical protein